MSRHSSHSDRRLFGGGKARSRRISLSGVLLGLVDIGLLAVLAGLPMLMGGRQALGQLMFALLSCVIAGCWSLYQFTRDRPCLRMSGAEPLIFAGIALVLFQLWDLPTGVIDRLSPHHSQILPVWRDGQLGTRAGPFITGPWSTLSLTPALTRSSLSQIIAGAMLFFVAAQRIRTVHDVRRILKTLCASALMMAVFGLAQLMTSNGKFFWFYEHPFSHTDYFAKGAFTNKNHFASFLGMSLPLFIWWLVSSSNERRRHGNVGARPDGATSLAPMAIAAGMAVISIAILLSQSRGGLVATSAGMLVTLVAMWRLGCLSSRAFGVVACVPVLAVVSLTCFGDQVERLAERSFSDLTSGDIEQLDRSQARRRIWSAVAQGIADYPLLGTGLGSHREVYSTYFNEADDGTEYSHAENGYLQVALETGLAGLSLVAALMLVAIIWCRRGMRRAESAELAGGTAAIGGAITVNFVHSLGDFVWYVPACMVVVLVLAACAFGLTQISTGNHVSARRTEGREGVPFARIGWAAGAVMACVLGIWVVHVKQPELAAEGSWHEYIRLEHLENSPDTIIDPEELRQQRISLILSAARRNPDDARLQLRAAHACEMLYHIQQEANPERMPLTHIREAARTAEFASEAEMNDWLNRPGVLGAEKRYLDESIACAKRALSLCPLLGSAYVHLAEHGWLQGAKVAAENALLIQALYVRPYDPHVNFVVGREGFRRGDFESALRYWKVAFERDADYQQEIMTLLAPLFSSEQMLREFEPDAEALVRLKDTYADLGDTEQSRQTARELVGRWSEEASRLSGERASALWCQVYSLSLELGDEETAGRAAEAAVDECPNSFAARSRWGAWLFRHEFYAQAREHLVWCSRRRPDDKTLQQQAAIATREARRNNSQLAERTATPDRRR